MEGGGKASDPEQAHLAAQDDRQRSTSWPSPDTIDDLGQAVAANRAVHPAADLVIDRGDGEPFPPDSLSRVWYRLVHRIGLPDLRLHDLRFASCIRNEAARGLGAPSVHPKVVSEALGHSSVSFTMDTYQHLMPTMQDAATRAIEEAIGGTLAAGLEDA